MITHEEYISEALRILEPKEPIRIQEFKALPASKLNRIFFLNKRTGKGFRLTDIGLELFQRCFENYIIDFPKKYFITSRHRIFLDRYCTYPYHFNNERIILFDRNDAFSLKLIDANLDQLIEMHPHLI